jgi:deoxyadenosine/deoxycytidine kinase
MFARLHNQVIEGLPRPSAIVLCDAPPDVCEARIQARARSLDRLYPDGHLARLGQHLSNWVRSFMEAPVLVFDSVNDDPRDIETATCVRQDVENFIQRGGIPNTCLRLYR